MPVSVPPIGRSLNAGYSSIAASGAFRKTSTLPRFIQANTKGAASGTEALQQAKQTRYDAALLDIQLPDLNGLSVLKVLMELDASLPVIILTGYSSEASAIEAINLGVQGYLTKPFRIPRVLAAAAKALGETVS